MGDGRGLVTAWNQEFKRGLITVVYIHIKGPDFIDCISTSTVRLACTKVIVWSRGALR